MQTSMTRKQNIVERKAFTWTDNALVPACLDSVNPISISEGMHGYLGITGRLRYRKE